MGLALSAEQKDLLKIFKIEEQYIIPAFQRPYSWGYDQCYQLYTDLIKAFESNEDYFIGNIIISKSDNDKDELEIIDGQQRMITILLLFKVLHSFQPELKVLKQILKQEDWEGVEGKTRIRSEIFEENDGDYIDDIIEYSTNKLNERLEECLDKSNKINERKTKHKLELNALYFLFWLKYYENKNKNVKEFISFLLKRVYLLPIELTGKTKEEANSKALVIFETINNRGMNLEDADIFKAKLYQRAKNVNEERIFIDSWVDLKNSCNKLGVTIDDVFRYYSHIIRGKEGITSSEINLREFFTRTTYSPLEQKKYKDILDELFKIVEILEFIDEERVSRSEASTWIQLIDIYTNQYPKYAIITYLYCNELKVDEKFITFLTSLVRYVYHQGSTTTVKFEIYNMIKQLSAGVAIGSYEKDIDTSFFDNTGRLKFGFSLLAFYLGSKVSLPAYSIDRVITYRDMEGLSSDWNNVNKDLIVDQIGNLVVLDIPKKNLLLAKKKEYYLKSDLNEIKMIFSNEFTYEFFKERDKELKNRLVRFFKNSIYE
ncbi:DUF262 domain-containing protein [Bacteroides graminisolvens]|uniref:DUF262 domain-containing protein n=1 Tax=Bacteroides graminisolvens TaxID=477666 RepID=UPI0023EF96F9|nr:DUF262 domain-containing protein [Bacteroides graminisolvens]MDD3211620.1 DUF262 domain-containing protein [Bacteroides graminisolvens]